MSRDENMYEDPEEFRPERFLDLEPVVLERIDPRKYVFGHGRRFVANSLPLHVCEASHFCLL